jgi:hypothetical protein
MPKIKKTNSASVKPQKKVTQITCAACGENKKVSEYYVSYNPIHQTSRIPYCKSCLRNMISDSVGNVQLEKLKETLRLIDRPFIYNLWKTSLEEPGDSFGNFMKNLAMVQYRKLGWEDSIFLPESDYELNYSNVDMELNNKKNDFIITDDIINKWGFGYSNDEYEYFEKKWNQLIDNYGEKTSFHIEGLKTYIRFRVKEEIATAKGNVKEAKEWATMAAASAQAAKINVSQLSKSDITGGVELVPQIFEAVESEIGIISILPKLKEQPYDDADLIIWCVINYGRRLEGKSRIEYREIWNFYDQMLEEYYKQKGYSKKEIKKEKEKRNNIFRDLSLVYKEPLYEDSDL